MTIDRCRLENDGPIPMASTNHEHGPRALGRVGPTDPMQDASSNPAYPEGWRMPRGARCEPVDPTVLMARICAPVAPAFGVSAAEVARPSLRRAVLDARALVSNAAVREHGVSLTAVGGQLGVSKQSVARAPSPKPAR